MYDQECTASFHQKLESIQCNSLFALTGIIRGTSTKNVYYDLNWEILKKKDAIRNCSVSIKFIETNV